MTHMTSNTASETTPDIHELQDIAPATAPHRSANPAPRRLDGYEPVARAIDFLVDNFEDAPGLDAVARHVGLSPEHFQRVFKAGAGVSPKRFLQYLAAREARKALADGAPLLEAAYAAGLSGPSRLHDLILNADAMTPGAVRRKGAGETIRYATVPSPFGAALIGATDQGVCWLSFADQSGDAGRAEAEMRNDWRAAEFVEDQAFVAPLAARAFAFACGAALDQPLGLHVQGTNFQLKVWEALLRIPLGVTCTYGDLARAIDAPKASRAVGSAVGSNMISLLIPCHRVILSSGVIHNYRWGAPRKKAILAMEGVIANG